MKISLWNSPITRRYLSALIFNGEKHHHHFGGNKSFVVLLPTFEATETVFVDRETYRKITDFWKMLESKKIVKMHDYIEHCNQLGIDLSTKIDTLYFSDPYEEVTFESETKVEVLNFKELQRIFSEMESEVNSELSLLDGLADLTRKHVLHFTKAGMFSIGDYTLKIEKGSRHYLVLASLLKRNVLGDNIVSYQQIEDDVPLVLTTPQRNYKKPERDKACKSNISASVTFINNEIDFQINNAVKKGDVKGNGGLVSISVVSKEGVKVLNPKRK